MVEKMGDMQFSSQGQQAHVITFRSVFTETSIKGELSSVVLSQLLYYSAVWCLLIRRQFDQIFRTKLSDLHLGIILKFAIVTNLKSLVSNYSTSPFNADFLTKESI